jgi:hypothetical protein|tara:strand:- start:4788 stop:6236 length:1449 start_codon:yes stop_codon:yes gene_type:complete
MAATLEIQYFNTFWIKKIKTVVDADGTPDVAPSAPYNDVPRLYNATVASDWYIEESRIRGGYQNLSVDFGVKAYIEEDNNQQQDRFNSLIYSGVFNSRTGVNDTNQFSVAEDITKSLDPSYASIQRLYAEDTNLIIFQEQKVSRALIDKDAIYSAEGNASITSSNLVIGQIVAYAGEYGISKDPFSFAVFGYRKYFTDRKRNCVCRLSRDGITEISGYGMQDFFRDELSTLGDSGKIRGGWDMHNKSYVLSLQNQNGNYNTLSFDESVLGWTSFMSFKPLFIDSLGANFYSFKTNQVYQHHKLDSNYPNQYGMFYGLDDGTSIAEDSTVTLVLNGQPSLIKTFKTLNYEGGTEWKMDSFLGSTIDSAIPTQATDASANVITKGVPINKFVQALNLTDLQDQLFQNNFKRKENKYFATLVNNTAVNNAEVFWGQDTAGIQGFFATVKMVLVNAVPRPIPETPQQGYGKKELFAVSTNYVESSY